MKIQGIASYVGCCALSVLAASSELPHGDDKARAVGLPTLYTLHVWGWKDNPTGMFVNWHPKAGAAL
jgi:hypothetical protein